MKKGLFSLLFCLIPLVAGCSSVKNENAIHTMMNDEIDVINLKADSVEYMINHKFSFVLLLYTSSCSYCSSAKDNLNKLKKEYNYALYQIEMFSASIEYLSEKLPSYFKMDDSYPFIYIINKGNISYKSNVNDLTNYAKMKKMINSYSRESSVYNFTTINSFDAFVKKNNRFLLFTYDSSLKEISYDYDRYTLDKAIELKKNVVFVDKFTAKSELSVEISNYYNSSFMSLTVIELGQKKTTLDYNIASGSEVKNFIDSYFSN